MSGTRRAMLTEPDPEIEIIENEETPPGAQEPGTSVESSRLCLGAAPDRQFKKTRVDPIWEYFNQELDEPTKALCLTCRKPISRGGTGRSATNSAIKNHLKLHQAQHSEYLKKKQAEEKVPTQPRIDVAFSAIRKWEINDPRAVAIHKRIGEMIALDCQPFHVVENAGFKRLLESLNSKYEVPGRTFFTTKIVPDIYEKCKVKIRKELEEAGSVSFTTDIWTATNSNESFLGLTAHWISSNFELMYIVLNTSHLPGSHTGTNITDKLNYHFEDWGLQPARRHLIIRDSAANMIKGLSDMKWNNESCFIHTLQLAVKDAIRSQRAVNDTIAAARAIATHFGHSALACTNLKTIQEQLNMPQHKIIQDVATRWNSTYYLLERLVEQKDAIILFAGTVQRIHC